MSTVVRKMVRMCNSDGIKRLHEVNFVVADIHSYDIS
jgi:hypothetical protein